MGRESRKGLSVGVYEGFDGVKGMRGRDGRGRRYPK